MNFNITSNEKFQRLELLNRSAGLVVFESFIMIVITCFAFVGNVLCCIVIFKTPSLIRNKTNIYITALALSDTLTAIFVMPLSIGVLVQGKWSYGNILCHFQGFTFLFTAFITPQTMSLIALNRYFCVVRPSQYRKWFQRRYCIAMLACVWLNSFVMALLPLVGQFGIFIFRGDRSICWITILDVVTNITYTVPILCLIFILPFGIMIVCYAKIFRSMRCHVRHLLTFHQTSGPRNVSVREIKITKQLFVLVAGFGICWIPAMVIDTIDQFFVLSRSVFMTYIYLIYISSSINPVIYGVMNQSFRIAFLNTFSCTNIRVHPTSKNPRQRDGDVN
ncbi:5-hydroxytryptamine receptor 4-like [Exaiptasia diaphana]|uniref:G-protein coupled receptors family 1 profile domain-containing protein n=1 Tax=Exaiptasia diaphana TaxID=2652724 RepID=A0A913XZ79_EXADI|nr:5-hydroxytryptamine receptor 4-like [Exaiptasia diaphana]